MDDLTPEERRLVEWLRLRGLHDYADAIERGEHKETTDD